MKYTVNRILIVLMYILSFCRLLVLQYRNNALTLFTIYTQSHPNFCSKQPPYKKQPLMNFVWFLLQASKQLSCNGQVNIRLSFLFLICRGDSTVFLCLRQKYHPALQRDPSFSEVSIWHVCIEMYSMLKMFFLSSTWTR